MPRHQDEQEHPARSARYVSDMYKTGRWFLAIVGYGFAAIFTALQIQHITIIPFINSVDGRSLTHIALLLYYYAWIEGSRIEFALSEKVYVADPGRGSISSIAGLVFGILILGIILFVVADDETYLSLAFLVFYLIDFVLWLFVRKRAATMAAVSADIFRNQHQYGRIEQLRCYATHYIRGNWQYVRYGARAILLIAILIGCNFASVRSSIADALSQLITGVTARTFFMLLPGSLILAYILLGEIWTWHMRLKAKRKIEFLDDLQWDYIFITRSPSDIVAPIV
jgi:hypothetical protein